MEAVSPGGVGNHSRRDSKSNIPSTEIKKNKRKFNKSMNVGNNIKNDNKGMYALDAIELTHAEMIQDLKWRRGMYTGTDYVTMYTGVMWPYMEHQELCTEAMQMQINQINKRRQMTYAEAVQMQCMKESQGKTSGVQHQ